MLNQETAAYLVGLGKEQVIIEANNGGQYTPGRLYRINEPTVAPIVTHSLTSIVDYVKNGIDYMDSKEMVIHIVSPQEVLLLSYVNGDRAREVYVDAQVILPNNVKFDQFLDTESFNIMLQSGFVNQSVVENVDGNDVEVDYKKMLLQVTGCVKEESIKQVGDDGVSQSAMIKTGVASIEAVKVPNPVLLAPYRTFQEVKQPLSKFIFRMKDGPSAALFEADGGAWRNDAIGRIKKYFEEQLKGIEINILA